MDYRLVDTDSFFVVQLQKAIQGEYGSMLCYQKLEQVAPPDYREYFGTRAQKERQSRLSELTRLYYGLTACYPVFNKVQLPQDYGSGLQHAIEESLALSGIYTNLLFAANHSEVQRFMMRSMYGEMQWNSRLQFLYSRNTARSGNVRKKGAVGVTKG